MQTYFPLIIILGKFSIILWYTAMPWSVTCRNTSLTLWFLICKDTIFFSFIEFFFIMHQEITHLVRF